MLEVKKINYLSYQSLLTYGQNPSSLPNPAAVVPVDFCFFTQKIPVNRLLSASGCLDEPALPPPNSQLRYSGGIAPRFL
jgi:hypothetical protein